MHPLTVVRQVAIDASWEHCWRCLTTPAVVAQWFAATGPIEPGAPVRFDFGDGDFFSGWITAMEAPSTLRLTWRFWDVGPAFDVTYVLAPANAGTEVSVIDRGSGSPEEVQSLREGWEDFLARLKRRAETGESCRYRWSESLGGSCYVDDVPALRARLADPRWWQSQFAGARLTLESGPAGYHIRVAEPAWDGRETAAHVRFDRHLGRGCLRVAHAGWAVLPFEAQVGIRRRYAEQWQLLLAALEREFAPAGCIAATAAATAGTP